MEKNKIKEIIRKVIKENKNLIKAFEIYDKTGSIEKGLEVLKNDRKRNVWVDN